MSIPFEYLTIWWDYVFVTGGNPSLRVSRYAPRFCPFPQFRHLDDLFAPMFYVKNTNTKACQTGTNPIYAFWKLLIGKRTEDGLVHFFVFPTEWHQTGKQRMAYTEEVVFMFFSSLMLWLKMKIGITDHFLCSPFCFWIRKKEKGTWLPPILFSIMESENEKRKDGVYTHQYRHIMFKINLPKHTIDL